MDRRPKGRGCAGKEKHRRTEGDESGKILLYGSAHYPDFLPAFADKLNILLTDGGRLIQIMPEGVSKESGLKRW